MQSLRTMGLWLSFVFGVLPCMAAPKFISIDTGECGEDVSAKETVTKSSLFVDKTHSLSAYGQISIWRSADDAKKKQCHVVYELFIADHGDQFREVKCLAWDSEEGEIAGIDLIGVSPDTSKFAADFWLAEGDGEEHRPVIYDAATKHETDLPLENKIQKLIHGCDQNEDFIGVTNTGEAVFAIPPSDYVDSSDCGDKGLWHFDLKTGRVYRVAKISGDKWR